ncbi:MerR family transcriptional regulator [Aggregatibacter kilianii]|uniref:MerR family transcriptional regulator n=1 Tax=Aggregatibacter kilianii TaxID=2025884 RepID=UPI000D650EAF|nr:MerR family transcriptional regulator [Aggregatibacter kilianii]
MKIGKLAKAVGCSVEAIRFYEQKGLMPRPSRSAGGFRLYTDDHLQRLSFICYCRSLDMSLEEIKLLLSLENASEQQKAEINQLLDRHIQDIAKHIHRLQHLRMNLIRLKQQCGEMDQQQNLLDILQRSQAKFRPLK